MCLVTPLPVSDRSPALEAHIDLEAAAHMAGQQDQQQQSHLPHSQVDMSMKSSLSPEVQSSLPGVGASTC